MPIKKMIQNIFILLLNSFIVVKAVDPWSFIVLADWHGAESFAVKADLEPLERGAYSDMSKIFQDFKALHDPDLILLPGDTQTGHWHEEWFQLYLQDMLDMTGLTTNETIQIAAENCYSNVKRIFKQSGFDKVLLAPGDHEYGGNPWKKESDKIKGLPIFRAELVNYFNRDENGAFLFDEPIGSASARPIGTSFVNTSYAHVHKNVLFITVDAFHQVSNVNKQGGFFNRRRSSGGEGIITCTVTGEHLTWFEDVLIEARKINSIKHIFVQAHVPILHPVRKTDCSGQFFDVAKYSNFWQTMRKYEVDAYFAGEVHANTVIKDDSTDLLQVITRGNRINNYMVVNVMEDGFSMHSFNEYGPKWRFNGMYEEYGKVVVDKSGLSTSIESSGSLELLDISKGPLIQFNFEKHEVYPFHQHQIVGMKHNQFREALLGQNITIRNETCTTSMKNIGIFGNQYDAQVANLEFNSTNAISGKSSGVFTDDTRVAIYGMGPFIGGEVISLSLFFRTSKSKEMILVFYGGVFGTSKRKDIFLLTLKKGNPALTFGSRRNYLTTAEDHNLDDGQWHHIAISIPSKSCLRSSIGMIIDGLDAPTVLNGKDEHVFFTTSGKLSLGGWGYSHHLYEAKFPKLSNFIGMMDNFQMWGGYSITPPLLLESMNRNFEKNAATCIPSLNSVYKRRKRKNQCKRVCLSRPDCWGYELQGKIRKTYKCFNYYGGRPEIGEPSTEGNQCNPVVR